MEKKRGTGDGGAREEPAWEEPGCGRPDLESLPREGRDMEVAFAEYPTVPSHLPWRPPFWMWLFTTAAALLAIVLMVRLGTAPSQRAIMPETNVQIGTLEDPAGEQARMASIVDEGMVTFSINATPQFGSGTEEGNLMIENPPENGNRFTVTIVRQDTGEEVYRSGYLDPGQYIRSAALDIPLPRGEYGCMAYIDTYRLGDTGHIGRVAAEVTVYVLN